MEYLSSLALHIPVLFAFALIGGASVWHSLTEVSIVGVILLAASLNPLSRRATATITSFGLITSSAILTHLSGGYIEFHFHFFIMLAVISLYQEWLPFIVSILYVLVHHGVMGAVDPHSVFNHPDAIAHPWKWAAIHAMFVSFACGVYLLAWRWNEVARDQAKLVLSSAGEGIVGLSPTGSVLFVNPSAERITGYQADELLGQTIGEILDPSGDIVGIDGPERALERSLSIPEGEAVDGIVKGKDGIVIPAEFIRSSIRDGAKLAGSVISFRDTSERVKSRGDDPASRLPRHGHRAGQPDLAPGPTCYGAGERPPWPSRTGGTLARP